MLTHTITVHTAQNLFESYPVFSFFFFENVDVAIILINVLYLTLLYLTICSAPAPGPRVSYYTHTYHLDFVSPPLPFFNRSCTDLDALFVCLRVVVYRSFVMGI